MKGMERVHFPLQEDNASAKLLQQRISKLEDLWERSLPAHNHPDAPGLYYRRIQGGRYRPGLREVLARNGGGCLVGLVLVILSIGGLFWNEGQAVQKARSLEEAHFKVVIPETNDVVFDENNGKLVHVADRIHIDDPLEDSAYGISVKAVKLRKIVQMFQWYEIEDHQESTMGTHDDDHDSHVITTYSYSTDWFDYLINSDSFDSSMGHHNPEDWPLNSSIVVNSRARVGGFLLGSELREKFEEYTIFTSDERPQDPSIKMHAGLYLHAENVWKPDVGDIRIQFSYAGHEGDQMTVVAKQSGRELRPYQTESGDVLLMLHSGLKHVDEVILHEHAQNRTWTWILRLVGWVVSFIGYNWMSTVLDFLVDEFAHVRDALILGNTSLPFSFALSTTFLASGIGWIVFRPMVGCLMIGVAVSPFIGPMVAIYLRRE
eukprot:maker-scaffold209_size256900-snap-gene-0.16 protein:Tk05652 transcript:maker-scaffold209_size256900-snap-gene-0.16-mRNA-1 annotation:"transmembrane protein 43"